MHQNTMVGLLCTLIKHRIKWDSFFGQYLAVDKVIFRSVSTWVLFSGMMGKVWFDINLIRAYDTLRTVKITL